MKRFIVGLLAVIGGFTIIAVIGIVGFLILAAISTPTVPSKTILELNLERAIPEDVPNDPIAMTVMEDVLTMRDLIDALEQAGNDDRVAGLVARIGSAPFGMGQIQEIRDAVLRFRSKNKFAVAFAETIGEFSPGTGGYYLSTAFEKVMLQPSGDVSLNGIIFETPFLRGTLDKLGVTPRMDHRYEYKNAMNTFTERQFTPAHREASDRLITSWYSQIVKAIAEARSMSEDQVRALVDRGPFLAQEALEARLVDGLAYKDEVYAELKQRAGGGSQFLYLSEYLDRAGRPHQSGSNTIALIYGIGGVQRGASGYDPVFGDTTMGSDTVAAAFRAAIENRDVKAIIFRVDSPGGSAVASDTIWRETIRAKEAGKPVIVSMGDVAGSGGYWVAMSAHKIVAQPGTITGSIGVLGGKMITTGFWDKVGLSWDEVHKGNNATMYTSTKDYTPEEWSRFQAELDRIYNEFTTKVAEGRKLPKERVHEIAKGRIWTGEDAKAIGLVDELGGLPVALRLAKEAAGIPEGDRVRLRVFPAKRTIAEALFGRDPENSEREGAQAALVRALEVIQPIARQVRMMSPNATRGAASMPPIYPKH